MVLKSLKKEQIRRLIIDAAKIYSRELAGRVFLYVFGSEYFEIVFKTDRFTHLTGVSTQLPAAKFYSLAKSGILNTGQFGFTSQHPMAVAKKKLPCLNNLPLLTNNLVCVVKDMKTLTCSYKIGVTNLSFTLCLTDNIDLSGRKIDDCLLPRSLRIKDKAIENSPFAEIVDFIFVKTYGSSIYSELTYSDNTKTLPDTIKSLVDAKFFIQQQH